ncbi:hypothetical protein MHK_004046 [Candidatus Magnetomorum sp. HK-1]|nr:hypothetical protein MHK_004046 [Candidatus Magnetomorum sp. HK-1]
MFSANYHSQADYPKLTAGGPSQEWWIEFKNTGKKIWENHNNNNKIVKLALGTDTQPDMQSGREFKCGWESPTRLAILKQESVPPGKIGHFSFQVKAPSSLKAGQYKLQVTPKSPAGWLKQDNGYSLNCFAIIDVAEKKTIGDIFSNQPFMSINTICLENDETNPYEESTGLQDFVVPNKDIQVISWDRRRCYHGDDVNMLIKCHEGVPDGSIVEIKVLEADSSSSDDVVKENIEGVVKNLRCKVPFKVDWMDYYDIEGSQYEFYFTATIKSGDSSPAKSKLLYVDTIKYIIL